MSGVNLLDAMLEVFKHKYVISGYTRLIYDSYVPGGGAIYYLHETLTNITNNNFANPDELFLGKMNESFIIKIFKKVEFVGHCDDFCVLFYVDYYFKSPVPGVTNATPLYEIPGYYFKKSIKFLKFPEIDLFEFMKKRLAKLNKIIPRFTTKKYKISREFCAGFIRAADMYDDYDDPVNIRKSKLLNKKVKRDYRRKRQISYRQ